MVAAGLFTFIFIYERYIRKTVTGPPNILPGLHATAVTSIQVQPKGQLAIRADRVGAGWQLTQPLTFP